MIEGIYKPRVSNVEDLRNPTILQNLEAMKQYVVEHAVQGPQGEQGPAGADGAPGATGAQGPQGEAATIEVDSVETLAAGSAATVENVGTPSDARLKFGIPQGIQGEKGERGEIGPAGATGPTGPQGATGATGPQGEQGPVGPTGPTGATGPTGPQGPQGERGADGASFVITGTVETVEDLPESGEAGEAWFVGATAPRLVYVWSSNLSAWVNQGTLQGPQGEQGPEGPQGATGATGATGPQGEQGPTGATGPTGPQGPQGDAATIEIDSVETLPAGSSATVENVGTTSDARLKFGIPQGEQGPQGPAGADGAPGATGAQGPKGETGPQGPAGEGVPTGGTSGQVLAKASDTDFDTEWTTFSIKKRFSFTLDQWNTVEEGQTFSNGLRLIQILLNNPFNCYLSGTFGSETYLLTPQITNRVLLNLQVTMFSAFFNNTTSSAGLNVQTFIRFYITNAGAYQCWNWTERSDGTQSYTDMTNVLKAAEWTLVCYYVD